jgi:CheY-like chemotaxis protein
MKTILIVDDEFAFVENLTELLQDEGYRVVSAANGKDGLERLQKEMPDLVLTDYTMPLANGRDLIRGMRALPDFRSLPVIMMSATTKTVSLADADGTIEVSAFLKKPFQLETLLDALVRLFGPGENGAS